MAKAQLAASSGAGSTAIPAPGATAAPTAGGGAAISGAITLSDAQLDAFVACARTKGPTGAVLADGWATLRAQPASTRALLGAALEIQATAIGCR
ncbi:MAG: hypothetical protein H7338_10085 [Candidatus Sericytochromatia bacterium]|nr:hypothetical protein [Candidatus Sericytochromatia bacterium]